MKTFYYEKLGFRTAVLDVNILSGKHIISRINTPMEFRGRGIGSRLLKRVCADADAEGIVLELFVSPSDGLDEDELHAWYSRHGFVSDPEVGKFFMVRKPIQDSSPEFAI